MKRIFIVFSIVLCLGVSAPFADASNTFDLNQDLSVNLDIWTVLSTDSFYKMPQFSSTSQFDAALIYADPQLLLTYSGGVALPEFNGFSVMQNTYFSDDDLVAYFLPGLVANITVDVFMFFGHETLAYEWDGKMIDLVPGTVFVGFNLGGGNNMDMVLALTPAGTFNAVPLPAAALLLGSGVAGLTVLRRKLA